MELLFSQRRAAFFFTSLNGARKTDKTKGKGRGKSEIVPVRTA